MSTNEQAKFFEKSWFCVLMLIFFAPVGIAFLWRYKHFSKNVSILLTAASAIFFIFLLATSPDSEDDLLDEDTLIETSAEATKSTATPSSTKDVNTSNKKSTEKPANTAPPKRKDAIDTSDKNISDFDNFNVISARNDATGKWKVCSIAESKFDVQKYALSYYKKYFKSDDEVHCIVNFTLKTTTCITCQSNFLDVAIHEYVDKEEHDAKKLCSGQLLNEYQVYLDNGDIEKIQ